MLLCGWLPVLSLVFFCVLWCSVAVLRLYDFMSYYFWSLATSCGSTNTELRNSYATTPNVLCNTVVLAVHYIAAVVLWL